MKEKLEELFKAVLSDAWLYGVIVDDDDPEDTVECTEWLRHECHKMGLRQMSFQDIPWDGGDKLKWHFRATDGTNWFVEASTEFWFVTVAAGRWPGVK